MSVTYRKAWKDRTKKDRIEYALTRFTGTIQRQSKKLREQERHNRILRVALWLSIGLNAGLVVVWILLTLK